MTDLDKKKTVNLEGAYGINFGNGGRCHETASRERVLFLKKSSGRS
jgi:hypothetical protein